MWLRHEWRGRQEVDDIQCVGFWKVISLRCGPWELVQRWGGGIHMNKGRVGEDRGSKEIDGCPLTGNVRGHPSISLLPLSSPTLHLFICIPPPHLCTISKDHT
jgi:hypothetical protein